MWHSTLLQKHHAAPENVTRAADQPAGGALENHVHDIDHLIDAHLLDASQAILATSAQQSNLGKSYAAMHCHILCYFDVTSHAHGAMQATAAHACQTGGGSATETPSTILRERHPPRALRVGAICILFLQ